MDTALEYLLSYLEEEFSSEPEVIVRVAPVAKSQRSPDLEQTGEEIPELASPGVSVRTRRRDYFFPSLWVKERRFSEVQKLAAFIKDHLH